MIKHLRVLVLSIAVSAFFVSIGLSAEVAHQEAALDLDDNASDAFFGDGWYGDLSFRAHAICETNPTVLFCITGLDAPVLEVPGIGGWNNGW